MNDLLFQLQQYEQQLHQLATRNQRAVVESLLHPDFFEIGRSGKRYQRQQVIDALVAESCDPGIQSAEFALSMINENCALLTYRSWRLDEPDNQTLRSSLWVKRAGDASGWRLLYHQGTPLVQAER